MKQTLLLLLLLLSISMSGYGQEPVPVIKARTNKAVIHWENGPARGWNITPEEKLDVFTTPKFSGKGMVRFKTDSDSMVIWLDPGGYKDFIVLLNGKDSCRTRIQSLQPKDFSTAYPEIHDTISLAINEHNTIFVTAVLNGTDTLQLNFDTGSSDITLTNQVLKNKIRSPLTLYNTRYDLQIGKRHYKSPVYPAELSGHGTEGRFGWDLFDGYIVELNYDKQLMIVHSKLPAYVAADKTLTKLDIKYADNIFLVESGITQSQVESRSWFLFDTGYERTAMLDDDFLEQSQFPKEKMEVISKRVMKGGQGNEIPVITADLELLTLGSYSLKHVPVQIQTANKPLPGLNINILGNEVLKRFNTFLDFQHNVVYLKPNKHFTDTYIDQQKNDQ